MKNFCQIVSIFVLSLLFASTVKGQDEINWEITFDEDKKELKYIASLAKGWHVYSQYLDENAGPVATEFTFEPNKALRLSKKIREPEGEKVFDKNFNAEITYFSDQVVFQQKVKRIEENTTLTGSVLYMVCNDSGCLPPAVKEFNINIKK
jgi:thiol:disulfide interchange protein DsbD